VHLSGISKLKRLMHINKKTPSCLAWRFLFLD